MNSRLIKRALDAPWMALQLVYAKVLLPYYKMVLMMKKIEIGPNLTLYGLPLIHKHRTSRVKIGKNFENRNWYSSNPLGARRTFLSTWQSGSEIVIGDDVGISGVVVCAAKSIRIGNGVLVGAGTTIVDTDFHPLPLQAKLRIHADTRSEAIVIEDHVFIGMNCVILKGVTIGENSVIGAGSVVVKDIPENSIAAGNPVKVIKHIN